MSLSKKSKAIQKPDKEEWYKGSVKFWNDQPQTFDGMLQGYGKIHATESDSSIRFIRQSPIAGFRRAIDMGAGIGRVSKAVLLPLFAEVDLCEPAASLITKAKENVPGVRKFYECGMQEFEYERSYDCVWVQWCAMYLTDKDLLAFLHKTRQNLTPAIDSKSGLLFVKENVSDEAILDNQDNSVMRTEKQFEALFSDSNFRVVQKSYQKGMPKELSKIACWVLAPAESDH